MRPHVVAAASVLASAALSNDRELARELVAIAEDVVGCSWTEQLEVCELLPVAVLERLEAVMTCG